MIERAKLKQIILDNAKDLQVSDGIDPVKLLCAIASNESSFGIENVPRYEPGYGRGGRYYDVRSHSNWGDWAACSYSSFQIMFCTAKELGFTGTPEQLWDDAIAIQWAIKLINVRIIGKQSATKLEQIAFAYNHGSFGHVNNFNDIANDGYVIRFMKAYNSY